MVYSTVFCLSTASRVSPANGGERHPADSYSRQSAAITRACLCITHRSHDGLAWDAANARRISRAGQRSGERD